MTALIVPLLGLFFWWAWRRRARLLTQFIHAKLAGQLTLGLSPQRRLAKLGLLLLIVTLLFLSLAQPKLGSEWQETEMRSLDILIGVDTSRSMLATDQSPNRLERAKLAVLDLMRLDKRDRLGLIAFSGKAFLQCPLTIDRNAFVQSVQSLSTGIIPQGGTALGEAMNEAIRTFENEEDNHKVLILMTDGEDHEEGIAGAIQKAKDIGMKVFTIGLGSPEGELIQVRNPQTGKLDFLKDDAGNVVKSRLNETLLRQLSTDTGAFYLPMQGADTIERLYASGLAGLTPSRVENQMTKRFIERFQWPLGFAILLLFIELLLPEVHRQTRKRTAAAAAALLCLCVAPSVCASPEEARRQMDNGNYKSALDTYEQILSETEDESPLKARLHYNAGTAAYNAKDFAKAEENFRQALSVPEAPLPLQQRAFYNLGNSMFRRGEATQNPDEKIKQWTGALKQFEGANSLSQQLETATDDEDALFNSEIVKKRLEQLEQQQQQQQNQDGKQNENDEQQDQENQDQQQNEQNSEEQQNQDQPSEQNKEQQSSENEEQKEDQQNNQQSGEQNDEEQKDQQNQTGSQGDDEKEQPQQGQSQERSDAGQAQQEGKMTEEQVRQLLDSLKQQERSLIYRPMQKGKTKRPGTFRDW
ncbi:MAG: hypothetical protein CBC62_07315 [Opitutia bacterium TMED102]|nr:MAG: hypothetical protein CBC62_07315 [Opitutae bacterium TMED102]